MAVLRIHDVCQIWKMNSLWYYTRGDLITVGMDWSPGRDTSEVFCIDLPEVGELLYQGTIFCCVYTLAETHMFTMPLSGRICAVNTVLETDPRVLEEDPYGSGWLVKVLGTNRGRESQSLSTAKRLLMVEGQTA